MDSDDEDEGAEIICCQGPPRCLLEGNEAIQAQIAGCVWCERHIVVDGEVYINRPGEC